MMSGRTCLVMFALAVSVATPAQADEICAKINGFIKSQLADPSQPHWVELHWGYDSDVVLWSKACRNSKDADSKEFCDWLMDNTSNEFRSSVPIRILKCFGYGFPNHAIGNWAVYDGKFEAEYRDGIWANLELATKGLREGESALRLSVVGIDGKAPEENLSEIRPYPLGGSTSE